AGSSRPSRRRIWAVRSLGRQARRVLRSQRRADRFFRADAGADDWGGSPRQQYTPSPAKNARDPLHTSRCPQCQRRGSYRTLAPRFRDPGSLWGLRGLPASQDAPPIPLIATAAWTSLWVSTP